MGHLSGQLIQLNAFDFQGEIYVQSFYGHGPEYSLAWNGLPKPKNGRNDRDHTNGQIHIPYNVLSAYGCDLVYVPIVYANRMNE
jgi:hypothetical protein